MFTCGSLLASFNKTKYALQPYTTFAMFQSSKMKFLLAVCVLMALLPLSTVAGPLAYGVCQTGCNAGVVACYAAAGFTFGTVTAGASTPLVIMGCNAALGVCMAGCVAAGFAPTL
ncbi:hypothetical protein GHT06_022719 [Daphnia sinensis]|uniref:Zygote-specific protein n=1 Tax=Daphnia sinensis TaxID=1820382 RepID=A0AAD5KHZ8_9CRUS|nr:hypothetical protein GHT06_022719 [Daphnia sinensis]